MKKIYLGGILLVALIAIGLSVKPAYLKFKQVRADSIAGSALVLFHDQTDLLNTAEDSLSKALSAYHLAPDRYMPNRALGTILTLIRPEESIKYWDIAKKIQPDISLDDSIEFVQCLLINRRIPDAEIELLDLLNSNPGNAKVQYYLSRLYLLKGDKQASFKYAKALTQNNKSPLFYHLFFVKKGLNSGFPKWKKDAESHFRLLLENDDLLDDSLIWQMIEFGNLKPELQELLAERLGKRVGSFHEELLWVDFRVKSNLISARDGYLYLKRKFTESSVDEIILLGNWSSNRGLHAEVCELINDQQALERRDCYTLLLSNLSKVEDWERAERLMNVDSPPLDPFWFNILKAKLNQVNGNLIASQHAWFRARSVVFDSVPKIWVLVRLGDQLNLEKETRLLLDKVIYLSDSPDSALKYLGSKLLKLRQYDRLFAELSTFSKRYPENPEIVNEWAYYAFILQRDHNLAEEKIDQLCRENPTQLSFHMTWAMGQVQKGNYREVLARLSQFDVEWETVYLKWRFILAMALAGVNEKDQANYYLEKIDLTSLSEPERDLYQRLIPDVP